LEKLAVGGFVFLRFFCPALVAPEAFGLWKGAINPSDRRSLILVSKIVQNMANGVSFGPKEPFMVPFNDLIEEKKPLMEKILETLSVGLNSGIACRHPLKPF